MATFPIIKQDTVKLAECEEPEIAIFMFAIDDQALAGVTQQITSAITSAVGSGSGNLVDQFSVLLTGDASNVTIPKLVNALVAVVKSITPQAVTTFYATKCCPPDGAEINRSATPQDFPTVKAVKVSASWDAPIPGHVVTCFCPHAVGGGMYEKIWGTCKTQVFILTWTVTIVFGPLEINYPFVAQINKVRVTSPCCCPPVDYKGVNEPPPQEDESTDEKQQEPDNSAPRNRSAARDQKKR